MQKDFPVLAPTHTQSYLCKQYALAILATPYVEKIILYFPSRGQQHILRCKRAAFMRKTNFLCSKKVTAMGERCGKNMSHTLTYHRRRKKQQQDSVRIDRKTGWSRAQASSVKCEMVARVCNFVCVCAFESAIANFKCSNMTCTIWWGREVLPYIVKFSFFSKDGRIFFILYFVA